MVSGSPPVREWFRDWFGEEYLALYPHRDEKEARDAVNLFRHVYSGAPGARLLDLACGAGRHLRELRTAGFDATGLDLSSTLLRSARSDGQADLLVQGDMRRLPFARGSFRGLTSFFTSFGYFADPLDDGDVLREISRVLCPGGMFMLDFLNAARVRAELVAEDSREVNGNRIVQSRRISEDVVVKRIRVQPISGGASRDFEERVRLYSPQELAALLSDVGLVTEHRFGDYEGADFVPESPRLILAGGLHTREESIS